MPDNLDVSDTIGSTHADMSPSVDQYFALLRMMMAGIRTAVGCHSEVVLHDFRDPEHSIVAIEGDVTNRNVGGTVSQIGVSIIAQGNAAQDRLNYITRAPNGRVLKSSTILLRDANGHVFGAFCINIDVTELRLLANIVADMAGSLNETPHPIAFADDIGQVIRAIIDEEEVALGNSIDRMTKRDRLSIFRSLERRGIFSLQRAIPQVAEYLGISRATAYTYLEEIRDVEMPEESAADAPLGKDGA